MRAPAAHLSTRRLSLTPLTPKDEAIVVDLLSNPQVRQYLGGPVPPAQRVARFQTYLKPPSGIGLWTIRQAELPEAIGLISLAPHHNDIDWEISYQLDPDHWNNGFATEAVGEVIAHAQNTLELPRVVAETQVANTASCRLLSRLGLFEIEQLERFGARQAIYSTSRKGAVRPDTDFH